MKYVIDKIENDIVLLESINDNNMTEVDIKLLPEGVKETDVLIFDGDSYILDNKAKEDRLDRIREKMEKLKKC